ncbi:hypothetical protein [Arenibaculum sp.]|uniref:hypothetical protein n=1 Tax=Arenibaculum sp. TaxID=2865862 RepID=UPI002E129468|nr:hypothetical protein [Arenibaculum sp.]
MPDVSITNTPAALVLEPGDVAVHAATRLRPTRRCADACEALYVVVHRRHGTWTHVYAIEAGTGRDRREVRLLRVLEGDRLDEAVHWAVNGTTHVAAAHRTARPAIAAQLETVGR